MIMIIKSIDATRIRVKCLLDGRGQRRMGRLVRFDREGKVPQLLYTTEVNRKASPDNEAV